MRTELPCPRRDELERLLLGDLPEEETAALEEHVADCPRCLETIRALQTEDALVVAVRAGGRAEDMPWPAVDEDLIARLYRLPQELPGPPSTIRDGPGAGAPLELSGLLEPPREPDELGRLGTYGILRVLGSGGMGIVFAARQDRPRRLVALKMILADPRAGRQRLERFRAESEILARLRHPHIVQIHEVGEHAGHPYFTMEYAAGGSLAQQLAGATLPPRDAAALIQTLAKAVHAAHEQGVVHRDLKPANVLLVSGGVVSGEWSEATTTHHSPLTTHHPKIGDFGLAKQLPGEASPAVGERTETGAILGTPGYMAPEQAAGQGQDVGPAVDIYALGALLYECLTGRPPFKAATILETLEQVRTQEPVPPGRLQPRLPRDLQTICLKCLHKEPRRRYASAGALADDLGRFLAGRPIAARPVRAWERAWKWARRQPAAALLLAGSMLAAIALPAGLLLHNAQLDQARQQAEQNEAQALRQQERARAYYRQARDTLERMLKHFESYGLGQVPQLQELQSRQLEEALAFYQDALGEQEHSDPRVRMDAAFAYKRAADIQQSFGRFPLARENYDRAIALLEALPPEHRDHLDSRKLRLASYHNRGTLAHNDRRVQDAEQDYRRALELVEGLIRDYPDDPWHHFALGQTEHLLGTLHQGHGRHMESEPHYLRAAAAYAVTLAAEPHSDVCRFHLADTLTNQALLYQNTRRPQEATAAFERAEALYQELRKRRPTDGGYQLSLAALYGNWGFLLSAQGKRDLALERHSQAVALADAILEREPRHLMARLRSYRAHGGRAQFYEEQGRFADAAADWERVVAVDDQPDAWARRVFLALTLARAGAHARAAAEARRLQDEATITGDGRYNLACVCALAAAQARTDARLEPAQRSTLAEEYASQAVALLARLHAEDYFENAEGRRILLTDPDLAAVRWRLDFLRLLWPRDAGKKQATSRSG